MFKMPLLDFLGIGEAIWDLIFDIFVKGPLYIVNGLGDAITFLSGQKVVEVIFGSNGHFLNMPPQYIIFVVIAIMLVVIFASGVILHAMMTRNIGSVIASLANRIIMIFILILLVPLFFWLLNFTVASIIHIILPTMQNGHLLANMVGSLGFTDGGKHDDWNYDSGYPDWNHYSLFLGAFGSWFCMAVFFLLGLTLIQRLFDIFILYIVSSWVIATAASNSHWQKVNIWKDLVIGRFISTIGIILTLTLFINLEPVMLNLATEVSSTLVGQVSFKLLFIAGGAIATLSTQQLISSLIGGTVGLSEGVRMLTTMKAASFAAKAGTLGVLGVGKSMIWGKNRGSGGSSGGSAIVAGLASGGIGRTASFATKATLGSVLATAGFISGTASSISTFGVRGTAKRAAKQAARPVVSLGKTIKNKSIAGFDKGNKHEVTNLKRAFKTQLKTEPINVVNPTKPETFTTEDRTAMKKSYKDNSPIYTSNSTEITSPGKNPMNSNSSDYSSLKTTSNPSNSSGTQDNIWERWNWSDLSQKDEKEAKEWYSKKLQNNQGWVTSNLDEFVPKMKEKWAKMQEDKDKKGNK